jgi:mannose-6-phosphate isomerase-like protein (cupin superfamily)
MKCGATRALPDDFDVLAPDGSEVRVLLAMTRGSMAHFQLPAGGVSLAVRHRTVEEIWYVISGVGEMWRSRDGYAQITPLTSGTCLTIPAGAAFQFRCLGSEPLASVAITMPPWPGPEEAEMTDGIWVPNAGGGSDLPRGPAIGPRHASVTASRGRGTCIRGCS